MVKIYKGAAHQVPCVLKEFNESAPVLCRIRSWVAALPVESPACYILDLGSGFGFLSMFLAEMLPSERVARCVLVDAGFPNRGVEASSGQISTEHIYGCGEWPITLHTLKVDLKKSRALNHVAERILRAPAPGNPAASAPALVCAVHLCNTLSLRAAQLFNEHLEVAGLALAPCCFPTQRHLAQGVVYQLGKHRFAAKTFLCAKVVPSSQERFARWNEHILEGIEPGQHGAKVLEHHSLHRPQGGMYAQDTYIFAERQWRPVLHRSIESEGECLRPATGGAVVVDADYGHAAAQNKHRQTRHLESQPHSTESHPEGEPSSEPRGPLQGQAPSTDLVSATDTETLFSDECDK